MTVHSQKRHAVISFLLCSIVHISQAFHLLEAICVNMVFTSNVEMINDTLEILCLDRCCIPLEGMCHIVSVLSHCRNLNHVSLPGNILTGLFSQFVPHPLLNVLYLSDTRLSSDDVNHLTHLIGSSKLPQLSLLGLMENSLDELKDETEKLLNASIKHHRRKLSIMICQNNFSGQFMEHWASQCEGTNITLDFGTDLDAYNDKL